MWSLIIEYLINSSLGLVLGKARKSAAEKLKDGDTTDEKLRDVIIEDLNDIKTKIDALSRKDLRSSYCFLKEGVVTLNLALAEDEQTSKNETNGAQNSDRQSRITAENESASGVLNEAIALSHAIQKLNNTSNGRLVSAKECFKAAREEATRAFCNEALSLPDRIMAAKLRVASKILECLQDTKVAATGCMLFLEELHNLPAVGETFSKHFKGGIKSMVYKDSRLENVKSVLSLNFATSEFVARFSGELPNVRNWPRVHLSARSETIHPLFVDLDVVMGIFDMEEFQPPQNQVISTEIDSWNCHCTNHQGQLLGSYEFDKHVSILNRSGELNTFCHVRQVTENFEGNSQNVAALAIDRYDNVFVIIKFEDCTRNKYVYHVLFVFDSSGNERYERVLKFLETFSPVKCVVDNDGDIIIHLECRDHLYVCDNNGNFKCYLSLEHNPDYELGSFTSLACVTDQKEIAMMCGTTNTSVDKVLVYTKDGKLKRTIKVKGSLLGVTYNDSASKIEILVRKESIFGKRQSYSILSYNENDEVECLCLPVHKLGWYEKFCSCPAVFIYCNSPGTDFKVIFM